jgi:hypothetical protein
LQRIAGELNGGGKKTHRPWTLLHLDNAKRHMSKRNLARMEELHLKHTARPPLALISHHQTSFSLDGSKASSLLDRLAISVSCLNSSTRF